MTTTTTTRHFNVDREAAFTYLTNPKNWPDFYAGIIAVAETNEPAFANAGDVVTFTYTLLGRRLEGHAKIDDIQPGGLVRHTASVRGLPDVQQEWTYRDVDGGLTIDVTLSTDESTSFFGRTVGRFVVSSTLERDVKRTLDNIDDIFALGVPQA